MMYIINKYIYVYITIIGQSTTAHSNIQVISWLSILFELIAREINNNFYRTHNEKIY